MLNIATRNFTIFYTDQNAADFRIQRDMLIASEPVNAKIVEKYTSLHPERYILGFYENKSNLAEEDGRLRDEFNKYCSSFGFAGDDYNKEVVFRDNTYHLIGFRPRNNKYKALLRNTQTGRITKATLGFVRAYIVD